MGFLDLTVRRARMLEVSVPLRVPFAISGGTLTHRRSIVVELETDHGVKGFGEAAPFDAPFYSAETVASVTSCVGDHLIPRVIGKTFGDSTSVWSCLGENVRGNRMARAAAETAWWDLQARAQSVSLASLVRDRIADLGAIVGRQNRFVTCGAALGIPESGDPADLRSEIRDALALGFRRIKIKVRPGWSELPASVACETARSHGDGETVSVDGNGAFDLSRDRGELEALDRLGLVFIEQPFGPECLWDSVIWNRSAATPLCLDESLTSDVVARQVLEMSGPHVWNLKVQRLGGLEETCRVYVRGLEAGVEMWVGTMPETGIGMQAALAVSALPGWRHPSDVGPSSWWYEVGMDPVSVEMSRDGEVEIPQGPGELPHFQRARTLHSWPD